LRVGESCSTPPKIVPNVKQDIFEALGITACAPFRVRVDVTVPPGRELVADEKGMDNGVHAPLAKVIHDVFKTMERELRRVVEKQRHEVKTHANSRSPK
jgi:hypothetical protein